MKVIEIEGFGRVTDDDGIVSDLDNTIVYSSPYNKFINYKGEKIEDQNYLKSDDFNKELLNAPSVSWIDKFKEIYQFTRRTFYISGRTQENRAVTIEWLKKHEIWDVGLKSTLQLPLTEYISYPIYIGLKAILIDRAIDEITVESQTTKSSVHVLEDDEVLLDIIRRIWAIDSKEYPIKLYLVKDGVLTRYNP